MRSGNLLLKSRPSSILDTTTIAEPWTIPGIRGVWTIKEAWAMLVASIIAVARTIVAIPDTTTVQ